MEGEQRCEEQRIEISRPVEILDPEVGIGVSGYTKDLSASGMRARFDVAPVPGDKVQLLVTLVDGTDPLETQGEVIWCESDTSGEGAEVGLRFVIDGVGKALEKSPVGNDAPRLTAAALKPGQCVTIDDAKGHSAEAIVEEVSHDGVVKINLCLGSEGAVSSCVAPAGDEVDVLDSAEDWKPHPVRDAWNWLRRYVGPVFSAAVKVILFLVEILNPLFKRIWALVPAKTHNRVEAFFNRLHLRRRFVEVLRVGTTVYASVASRVASLRNSPTQSRSGDA